jgi:hypothetical protein
MTETMSIADVYEKLSTENPGEDRITGSAQNVEPMPAAEAAPAENTPALEKEPPAGTPAIEALREKAPEAEQAAAPEPEIDPVIAPPGLDEDDKKAFAEAPPRLQARIAAIIKGQQRSYTQRMQEVSQRARSLEQIAEVAKAAQPHEESLRRSGVNPVQAYSTMLEWASYLERDPNAAIRELADLYGATPPAGAVAPGQAAPPPAAPPPQRTMYDPRVDQLLAAQQQQAQVRIAAMQEQMAQASQSWRAATDESGTLKHPYLDELENTMVEFIPVVQRRNGNLTPTEILDRAYKLAIQEHPEVGEAIAKREAARAKASAVTQQANSANKARSANGVKGTGGSVKPMINMSDTGAVMRAIMDGTLSSI